MQMHDFHQVTPKHTSRNFMDMRVTSHAALSCRVLGLNIPSTHHTKVAAFRGNRSFFTPSAARMRSWTAPSGMVCPGGPGPRVLEARRCTRALPSTKGASSSPDPLARLAERLCEGVPDCLDGDGSPCNSFQI